MAEKNPDEAVRILSFETSTESPKSQSKPSLRRPAIRRAVPISSDAYEPGIPELQLGTTDSPAGMPHLQLDLQSKFTKGFEPGRNRSSRAGARESRVYDTLLTVLSKEKNDGRGSCKPDFVVRRFCRRRRS